MLPKLAKLNRNSWSACSARWWFAGRTAGRSRRRSSSPFRKITPTAGLGTVWVPREMRHTFVCLLSFNGTALEDIADLVGHRGTATTETVCRKVIVPELRRGAEVMDRLFT